MRRGRAAREGAGGARRIADSNVVPSTRTAAVDLAAATGSRSSKARRKKLLWTPTYLRLKYGLRMAKPANTAASASLRVTLSAQSEQLLEVLAAQGIYGRNPAEVAGRFVDQALQRLVEAGRLHIVNPNASPTKGGKS
jgi:hypothetical protein